MSAACVPRSLSTVLSIVVSTVGMWDRASVGLDCHGPLIMQSTVHRKQLADRGAQIAVQNKSWLCTVRAGFLGEAAV